MDLDSVVGGARFPSGSQRWTAPKEYDTKMGGKGGKPATSAPAAGYTVIEARDTRANVGARVSFGSRQQALRYMNLLYHGIPEEMAEDLAS